MSKRNKSHATLIYSVAVALILGLLAILPEIARPKRYPFLLSGGSAAAPLLFPIDRQLGTLRSDGRARSSVLDLIPSGGMAIVNFWATWCPPCIDELPSLEFLTRSLAKTNSPTLRVVAISVDSPLSLVPKLFKTLDFKPTFPVLNDPKGELAHSVGISKFPETLLINGKGEVVHKWVGPQDWLSAEVLDTIRRNTQKPE